MQYRIFETVQDTTKVSMMD